MAVYVSTTFFGDGSSLNDAVESLNSIKVTNIELGSNHNNVDLGALDYSSCKYISHNYFLAKDPNFVVNLASQNPIILEKSLGVLRTSIKACKKYGIGVYTIHPGFMGEASVIPVGRENRNFDFVFSDMNFKEPRKAVIEQVLRVIENLSDFANIHGVRLLVENAGSVTSRGNIIFDTVGELELLRKVAGVGFNLNLAHALLAGIQLDDPLVFKVLYDNSLYFEVSEISGKLDSHLPIKAGKGKIMSILKRYLSDFARKNIILEYRNISSLEVKKSYEFVSQLLYFHSPVLKQIR